MSEEIIGQLAGLESIVDKYAGFVVEEAGQIRRELNVPPLDALRKHLGELAEEQRLLNIGVIGRVKAGKSSLLNAVLFDGEDILPKAATPKTASLTVITHGDRFAVSVEYFTPEDIALIEKEHRGFSAELDKLIAQKKKEIEEKNRRSAGRPRPPGAERAENDDEKARRQAQGALGKHRWAASFDQYERMKKNGRLEEMKKRPAAVERLTAGDLGDLKGRLAEYVGSEGVLMPFTKSVRLELPIDSLRDIQVVDTPGINDPVKSREQRTQDYLKKCDVVLIVSPAGQFLTCEDTDLMDRITAREGVREMYIVAAQTDTQLHGDKLDKSGGDLHRALEMIRAELGEHAVATLENLERATPEVGGAFRQLIDGGKDRVMLNSAICHAMQRRFDERSAWDPGMNKAWDNLEHNYPDYFGSAASAAAALETLANIATVQGGLAAARRSKDAIIEKKRADYLAGQTKTVRDFRLRLKKGIEDRIEVVRDTDMAQVLEQKKTNEKLLAAGSEAVDGAYEDSLDRFQAELRETVMRQAKRLFDETRNETQGAVETTTETRTWRRKKDGFCAWVAGLWGGGYEDVSRLEKITTVRAGAVKSLINDLVNDLQEELTGAVNKAKRDWKKSVQREVAVELEKAVEDAGQFYSMLNTALRNCINSMRLPDMEIDYPFKSDASGVLEGSSVDRFMEEASSYLDGLRTHYKKRVDSFVREIVRSASEKKMSGMIFADIRDRLEILEKDIEDKESTLGRLKRCLDELNKLDVA